MITLTRPFAMGTIATTILVSGMVCALACGQSWHQIGEFLLYPNQFWQCPLCGRLLIIGMLGLMMLGIGYGVLSAISPLVKPQIKLISTKALNPLDQGYAGPTTEVRPGTEPNLERPSL